MIENDKFPPKQFLFTEGKEEEHLHFLQSKVELNALYDSVSQCNKCAFCSRVCPAQLFDKSEHQSPRARNMLLRFIMEGKLALKPEHYADIKKITINCMLCGACARECFAGVPTHEHVLELERKIGQRKLSFFKRRKFFKEPHRQLKAKISKYLKTAPQKEAKYFYLPSLEAKGSCGKEGLKVFKYLHEAYGAAVLYNASGMYEYVYAALPSARASALALMAAYESAADKKQTIVTESLELYSFIKNYPQLFYATAHYEQAYGFAQKVVFLADILAPAKEAQGDGPKVMLSLTNAFDARPEIFESFLKLLSLKYAQNHYPEWTGAKYPLPVLGYEYINKDLSLKTLKQKADYAQQAGAEIIYTPSIAQKKLLDKALKKYYPKCKAFYIGDLI